MELYYKEERDRDLFRAYNEALKSLGKMAVNVPREQIVRRVVYSIAPRFYISYEEARRNVKRIFKGYSPRCVSSTRTEMYNDLANMLASYLRRRPQVPFNDALCTILAEKRAPRFYLSERSALLTIYRMQKEVYREKVSLYFVYCFPVLFGLVIRLVRQSVRLGKIACILLIAIYMSSLIRCVGMNGRGLPNGNGYM